MVYKGIKIKGRFSRKLPPSLARVVFKHNRRWGYIKKQAGAGVRNYLQKKKKKRYSKFNWRKHAGV